MKKVIPQKRTTVSQSRLTLAQLAAKQEELERRFSALEKHHNKMLSTMNHTIDDFTTGIKASVNRMHEKAIEHTFMGLMPHMSRIYEAYEKQRDKSKC